MTTRHGITGNGRDTQYQYETVSNRMKYRYSHVYQHYQRQPAAAPLMSRFLIRHEPRRRMPQKARRHAAHFTSHWHTPATEILYATPTAAVTVSH